MVDRVEVEPPRWAFWRYGYLAYQMIRDHKISCAEAHRQFAATNDRIEEKVDRTEGKVDQVLSTVRTFVDMQPDLKSSLDKAKDRKAVWHFLELTGKVVAGILTAIIAIVTIGIWLVPYVKTWL